MGLQTSIVHCDAIIALRIVGAAAADTERAGQSVGAVVVALAGHTHTRHADGCATSATRVAAGTGIDAIHTRTGRAEAGTELTRGLGGDGCVAASARRIARVDGTLVAVVATRVERRVHDRVCLFVAAVDRAGECVVADWRRAGDTAVEIGEHVEGIAYLVAVAPAPVAADFVAGNAHTLAGLTRVGRAREPVVALCVVGATDTRAAGFVAAQSFGAVEVATALNAACCVADRRANAAPGVDGRAFFVVEAEHTHADFAAHAVAAVCARWLEAAEAGARLVASVDGARVGVETRRRALAAVGRVAAVAVDRNVARQIGVELCVGVGGHIGRVRCGVEVA
jgi:hypothetical protein